MNECGPAIQLCKARENVCKWAILVCEIMEGLYPAVNELKKSLFVCFGNGDQLTGNFYPAALDRFYFIYGNHIRFVYPAYQPGRYQLLKLIKTLQSHDFFA